jgi:4-hydroxybenzoate polyprenyltransferase
MTRTFRDYLVERLSPTVFVPAVSGLWLSAIWAAGTGHPASSYARSLLLMTLLVLQFRLWDDLEDVERDRAAHPRRVLVRSPVLPFRWALVVLATLALGVGALFSAVAAAQVAALDVLFLIAYRLTRPQIPDVVWRFAVLLAKYPAFVAVTALAIGGAPDRRLALAMLVTMTGACLYEVVHRRDQPTGVAS